MLTFSVNRGGDLRQVSLYWWAMDETSPLLQKYKTFHMISFISFCIIEGFDMRTTKYETNVRNQVRNIWHSHPRDQNNPVTSQMPYIYKQLYSSDDEERKWNK